MDDLDFTLHAKVMIEEREIHLRWIFETVNNPDKTEFINDEELHYIIQINEFGNRFLRVVVNPFAIPQKVITVFFDRRIKVI